MANLMIRSTVLAGLIGPLAAIPSKVVRQVLVENEPEQDRETTAGRQHFAPAAVAAAPG